MEKQLMERSLMVKGMSKSVVLALISGFLAVDDLTTGNMWGLLMLVVSGLEVNDITQYYQAFKALDSKKEEQS